MNCVATNAPGGAEHGQASGRPRCRRGADAGAVGTVNDVTFEVTRGVTRPVWEPDAGTMALYDKARGVAKATGLELPTAAPAAARTAISPARWASRRWTASVSAAPAHTLNEHIVSGALPSATADGRPAGELDEGFGAFPMAQDAPCLGRVRK